MKKKERDQKAIFRPVSYVWCWCWGALRAVSGAARTEPHVDRKFSVLEAAEGKKK
jgi:hypothetical protein